MLALAKCCDIRGRDMLLLDNSQLHGGNSNSTLCQDNYFPVTTCHVLRYIDVH